MSKKKALPPLDLSVLRTLSRDSRQIYSPTLHPAIIARLSGCGLSNKQIAEFLGIDPRRLTEWSNKYQVVRRALEASRIERDLAVVDALYKTAVGYEHEDDDIRVAGGEVVITPMVKHVQPNVRAQEIWLYNRMPDQWKSRSAIELTGKDGGPMEHVNMTPEQAAEALAALGLTTRAVSQLDGKAIDDSDDNA